MSEQWMPVFFLTHSILLVANMVMIHLRFQFVLSKFGIPGRKSLRAVTSLHSTEHAPTQ